jgi:5-formyltetrahydrofolate cyclo-ligase
MNKFEKEIQRSEIIALLKALEKDWLESAASVLCNNLSNLLDNNFQGIKIILAWASFFPGEPDLATFIARQLSHKKVFLPRSLPDFSLDFRRADSDWAQNLKPGVHGIPEPQAEGEGFNSADAANAVILVPALAFDRSGNRLGRGKGYYDRFLAKPEHEKIPRIGISWSKQIVGRVQTKFHDKAVNWICTEEEVLEI